MASAWRRLITPLLAIEQVGLLPVELAELFGTIWKEGQADDLIGQARLAERSSSFVRMAHVEDNVMGLWLGNCLAMLAMRCVPELL